MNDRNPRRPNDRSARAPRARDVASRQARGDKPPERGSRRGGPKPEVRRDGAPKRASRSDGAPRREPRRAGTPKRDSEGATPPRRELRRDGPQKRQSRASTSKGTAKSGRAGKRTSRSSDERSPTRSSVDYPSPKFRRKNEDLEPAPQARRSSLRKVRQAPEAASRPSRERKSSRPRPARRGRVRTTGAGDELARLAGRGARRAETELARAADAFAAGRERDAARLLRPLRDAYPDASAVRELLGLCQYRLGQYQAATKELEAFAELTNSVEQHPVLMDCARALGRHRRVEELWEELAAASPSGALVTEGRIVLAGARADQGRLTEAIATLDRRSPQQHRVQDHHVRVWYALGDLYERAGDLPKARDLFQRIRRHDAGFADVAERLAALG